MQSVRSRIELVDIARGVALVAMAIYHFTWDLDFFGYIPPGTSVTGGWVVFARSIASSFLFLVGVSLVLAHRDGVRIRPFVKRLAMIAVSAAAITAVTYVVTPDAFIFFGILHIIAVASLLGVLVLRLPATALLALAALVLVAPHFVHAPFLDHPVFWWTGFSRNVRPSNDFFPVFPWFGVILLGMAAAKIAARTGLLARLAEIHTPAGLPPLAAIGRHSLAFYLLHQPVLFSGVWLFSQVMPAPPIDREPVFLRACTEQCAAQQEEPFCRAYCGCVLDAATLEGRLDALFSATRDEETQSWLNNVVFRCSVENNG